MPKPVNNNIDVGLAALVKHAAPGQTMSIDDIAEVCQCNRSYVSKITQDALKKAKIFAERRQLQDFLRD